jgi:hypothetical protein
MTDKPKYAVLKWADWENLTAYELPYPSAMTPLLLPDAEIIRKQDITSGPIFHMYANLILSYADLLTGDVGNFRPRPSAASDEQLKHLQDVADHFHNAALDAENLPLISKKLPD